MSPEVSRCGVGTAVHQNLKLHLQSTDYGNFLANEASPLTVSVIDDKLKEKMVVEFRHMRNHAYEPLASFLDFITYSYMIDNVILLITGTLHQRSISELVPKCHPLGSFEQMEAVNIAQTPAELYNAILVDTPLAAFFQDCISEQDLDEMNIEIIRNTLYKAYLESFYKFCKALGGTTADAMCPILEFEADRRAFIITINSFGTELSKEDRAKLFPHCGKLYPEGLAQLARADDYEQVKNVADYYPVSALGDWRKDLLCLRASQGPGGACGWTAWGGGCLSSAVWGRRAPCPLAEAVCASVCGCRVLAQPRWSVRGRDVPGASCLQAPHRDAASSSARFRGGAGSLAGSVMLTDGRRAFPALLGFVVSGSPGGVCAVQPHSIPCAHRADDSWLLWVLC
uniref:ATPase H+ transporting V0 subunit d1 n=1 Tax=Anser cygnoides TaxID=8845 RepID=A0A8B9EM03_ANSCY